MTATVVAIRPEAVSEDRAKEQRHRILKTMQGPLYNYVVTTPKISDEYEKLQIRKLYLVANDLLGDALTSVLESSDDDGALSEDQYQQFEERLTRLGEDVHQYFEEQLKADNPLGLFEVLDLDRLQSWRAFGRLSELTLDHLLPELKDDPARHIRFTLLNLESEPIRAWVKQTHNEQHFSFPELQRDEQGRWIDGRAAS